ncbi:carbohydrate kinase family protein [Oricola sp.]|uniref:carbohydrate kinase family protein n=1 Tax=Oricola sp. TaxID=1979950 RepID=UPI003BAD332A
MLTVFGDPTLDHIYELKDPVVRGGKMLGLYTEEVPGGTTANVACAAARFALPSRVVGRVAAGGEAQLHRESYTAFGVDTDRLVEVETARGTHAIIAVDDDGEKTLIYAPMDAAPISQTIVSEAISETRYAYVMAADFQTISAYAGEAQATICVDVDAAAGLTLEQFERLRRETDILFINDIGFRKLTGNEPDQDGMRSLIGPRTEIVCCTGGGNITYMATRRDGALTSFSRAALQADVVDTTGAGDCFNAGFLAELSRGQWPEAALDFAMAAGALATETRGARAAVPDLGAVRNRLAGAS